MLPTDEQIKALHQKYAKSNTDFELVYTHCQIIETITMQLLDANPIANIDRQLVHIGSLLHDIGAYDVLENGKFVAGVRHGVIGEEILKREGYPESIWRFASHHTGIDLSEQDVIKQGLPIPAADYAPRTDEERIVMYADKFHSKSNPPVESPYFCTVRWFHNYVQKFGSDKPERFNELVNFFGKPDLTPLSERFGHAIVDI